MAARELRDAAHGKGSAGPRRTRWGLAVAAALVLIGTVGGLAQVRLDTGITSFLPRGEGSTAALERSARSFGGDPVVVLLESERPRQLLGARQLPRLLRLEGRLAGLRDVAVVFGPATMLNQLAIEAQSLLAAISGRRDGIEAAAVRAALDRGESTAQAAAAGRAAVENFDLRYGRLLVQGMPAGLPTLRNPRFVQQVVFDGQGQPKPRWHFVVPRGDAVTILVRPRQGLDQDGTDALVAAVREAVDDSGLNVQRVTVTGVPAVTAALASQVRQEIPLLGGLALALVAGTILLFPWLSRRRDQMLPFLATLAGMGIVLSVFGWLDLPLSLGLVAFLPILLGTGSDFPMYLAQPEQRRRALVAAAATSSSFGSLAVSPLPFVRDLGIALAVGVLVTVAVALAVMGLRTRRTPEPPLTSPAGAEREDVPAGPAAGRGARLVAVVVLTALAGAGWVGLGRMDVESRPDHLASGLAAVDDVRHVEDVLGTSGEVAVSLRGPDVVSPAALRWSREAEEQLVLRLGDQLRPVLTPARLLGFLGEEPTSDQVSAGLQLLPAYLTEAVVRADRRESAMVFGLRLQGLDEQSGLVRQIRAALPPPPSGMTVEVVGLPVLAAQGYDAVSGDRYLSSALGLGLVFAILALGLSRRDAFLAVVAAGLATGWGLLLAWLSGIQLTPLTTALGSLTAATGSEFAVLLASAHLTGRSRLRRTVAVAGLTSAAGYLALTLSDIAMIRQFGWLLAVSIALAYLAAYVVVRLLPASGPTAAHPTAVPSAVAADEPAADSLAGVNLTAATRGALR